MFFYIKNGSLVSVENNDIEYKENIFFKEILKKISLT